MEAFALGAVMMQAGLLSASINLEVEVKNSPRLDATREGM